MTTEARTAHTAGPYTIQALEEAHHSYDGWPTFAIRSPQNVCLATVGDVDRLGAEHNEANARLFAAAPNLLAALESITETCARGFPKGYTVETMLYELKLSAEAAIAKAHGA